MEKIKGIGKVAVWLLGHILCLAIYTIDRMITVFTPWNASPKYLTWYSYVNDPVNIPILNENDEVISTQPNFFYKSVARVVFVIIGSLTHLLSSFLFDEYVFLMSVVFNICLIVVFVSFDRVKYIRKAKNAIKSASIIILLVALSSCGKNKEHLVNIYVQDDVGVDESGTFILK